MKKLFIILLVLVIVLIIVLVIFSNIKRKNQLDEITIEYLYFSYSTSTMANGNVVYEINHKDNKYIASIKPNDKSGEEKLEIELDNKTIEKIKDVLNKYNVSSWNKFNKHDQNVLDGNGFSFTLKMHNGKKIMATGYMKWPTNYGKVKEELDNIFNALS